MPHGYHVLLGIVSKDLALAAGCWFPSSYEAMAKDPRSSNDLNRPIHAHATHHDQMYGARHPQVCLIKRCPHPFCMLTLPLFSFMYTYINTRNA